MLAFAPPAVPLPSASEPVAPPRSVALLTAVLLADAPLLVAEDAAWLVSVASRLAVPPCAVPREFVASASWPDVAQLSLATGST